jgi:hypothetical protein
MPPDLFKYLFEIAPVVGVLGWWILTLKQDNTRLIKALSDKDERIEKEVTYTKERDKENLKAILESAAVLRELSNCLRTSEGKIVGTVVDKAKEGGDHLDRVAADLKERIKEGK